MTDQNEIRALKASFRGAVDTAASLAALADKVNGHDFPGPEVPRAYPYGIYDLKRNAGFVNVGTDHDTGAFAVASIRGWWRAEGRRLYRRRGDC